MILDENLNFEIFSLKIFLNRWQWARCKSFFPPYSPLPNFTPHFQTSLPTAHSHKICITNQCEQALDYFERVVLKKNNGNIDARNSFGSTALHLVVWRNHIPIMRRLLAGGANPDIQDGESGWSSLHHRALHFGHLAVARVLIEAGANLLLEDSKGRTPIDHVSGPVKQGMDDPSNGGGTECMTYITNAKL